MLRTSTLVGSTYTSDIDTNCVQNFIVMADLVGEDYIFKLAFFLGVCGLASHSYFRSLIKNRKWLSTIL